ncbi:MAG TPA: hypothetical protein VE173_08895 [Longimicrobiales bacterium]|nr:hypothetical protein [Longimicrobiales bacterium]
MVYPDRVYGERVRRFTQRIETVLFDAYRRMDADREERGMDPPRPGEVQLFSWPQEWPDWSCGFGGEARQVPCIDQTHVVTDEGAHVVYVYHAARFVRRLDTPGKAFWVAVRKHKLPGALDEKEWAKLENPD